MKLLQNAGIYVIRKRDDGKCYVGKDSQLGKRVYQHMTLNAPECTAIHNAVKKHGKDAFDVELIHYPNISSEALNAVETWKIRQLGSHVSQGGYNLTFGGDGFTSETARETNLKRIADGTHNFQGGEIQRANAHKRIAEGTHQFQDSEFHRKHQQKRIEDGTHHCLTNSFQQRGRYASRMKFKNRRREFYRWVSVILTAKAVCEERIYRKRIREGYFDKDIPNSSKSDQLSFLPHLS